MFKESGSFLLDLCSKDVPKSLEFYRDTLGGTLLYYDEPRKGWDGFFMVQMGPAIVMVGNFAANLEGEHAVSPERRAYLHKNKWGVGMTPFFKDVRHELSIKFLRRGTVMNAPGTKIHFVVFRIKRSVVHILAFFFAAFTDDLHLENGPGRQGIRMVFEKRQTVSHISLSPDCTNFCMIRLKEHKKARKGIYVLVNPKQKGRQIYFPPAAVLSFPL
jgi:hypothetical protein